MNITLTQVIAIMGGSSVVVVGVSSWISHLVTARIVSKWHRDEQTVIEILRSALAGDKVLLESSIKGFQTGLEINQPKRLFAIERLWTEVLRLRQEFSQPVFFCSIFLPEEYDSLLESRRDLIALIAEMDLKAITDKISKSNELERERPYLGETLWLRFFIYRAFLGRLATILSSGVENGRLEDWRTDKGIRQILSNVLSPENVEAFLEKVPFILAINRTVGALESLLLEEISLIVSGKRSSFESFENAKKLQDTIAALDRPLGGFSSPSIK